MIEKKKKLIDVKMKKLDGDKYKVLAHDGHSGLTVGSYVLKPGSIFLESDWPYGMPSLKAAIAGKRCKLVKEKKEKVKNDDSE